MSLAARTFWSMYFLNVLRRENLISQEEYATLMGDPDVVPLYNKRVTVYNNAEIRNQRTGGPP